MKIPLPSRIQCGLLALSIVFLPHIARAATTIVQVGQGGARTFAPNSVSIQPGDTVEWDWVSGLHSATSGTPGSPDGTFDSGAHGVPFTYSYTFATPGSFPYYCTVHGAMMVGTVNVVAPTPTPGPINISGTVSYCSNPVPGPVPNVTLTLTGTMSGSTLSAGDGTYTFSVSSGGNYTVTPTKAARTPGTGNINTVDVIAVQKQFLTGTFLSGCKLAAADVNGDTFVTTQDVIAVQRFFNGFTSAIANTGKYQFTPVNHTYSGVGSNQTGQNFDTLVFGDVASPFSERWEDPSQSAAGNSTSAGEVPATVAAVALPEVAINQSKSPFSPR